MLLRAIVIVVSGLGLAAAGVFASQRLMTGDAPEQVTIQTEIETTEVIVAKVPIPFGTALTRELVRVQDWPTEFVPSDALTSLDEVIGDNERGFRRVKRPISAGEPLFASKISDFDEKVTIAQMIDRGKRAMSVRVDDVSGVGGFVTPGDRVDVVLTSSRGDDQVAITILQDVLVRAVDQIADEDRDKPVVVRTVTVEVKPDEAQKLVLAQQAGRLSLTLRPIGMHDEIITPTTTISSLTNIASEAQTEDDTDAGLSVTIRRGAAQEVVPVVR